MSYKLDMGIWNNVFAVPTLLVDKYIKLARGSEIKVLLYALRRGGEEFDEKEASEALGLSEEIVEEAFEYWLQQGLMKKEGNTLSPKTEKTMPKTEPLPLKSIEEEKVFSANTSDAGRANVRFRAVRPDNLYVAGRINECKELRDLVSEIEMCLGKTITPTLLSSIVNAYDDYGLPSEVIMMLFSYVKKIGKTSTPYIESVIHEWGMSGVDSAEAADKKIKDLDSRSIAWKKLVRIFGMDYRSPSKKEEECAYRWVKEYAFPEELIREAYDRCVNNTGKMQMRYINTIMENWYASGIKTVEELNDFENKAMENKERASSFDISELKNIGIFD